jgi:predicted PurR-regulated permease PerM
MSEPIAEPSIAMTAPRRRLDAPVRAVVLAAILVVAGLLFPLLASLAVAMLITVILALPLTAWTDRLQRLGVPRPIGAISGLLLALASLAGIVMLLAPSFSHELNELIDTLPRTVDDLKRALSQATGSRPDEVTQRLQDLLRGYADHPLRLLGPAASVGLGVLAVVGGLLVMLLTALFIAINPQPLVTGLLRLLPPAQRPHGARVLARLRAAWLGWLRGLAIAMVLIGLLVYAGLRIVGLRYAVAFAVLSALLEVVPYFGALVSGAPAVLFALTISPGKALAVLAVYVIAHQVDGNVVSPLVMARAARLHPAVVAIGVIVVERVFGFLGLIVAVPIISAFLIVVEELWVRPNEERADPGPASATTVARRPARGAQRRRDDRAAPDADGRSGTRAGGLRF